MLFAMEPHQETTFIGTSKKKNRLEIKNKCNLVLALLFPNLDFKSGINVEGYHKCLAQSRSCVIPILFGAIVFPLTTWYLFQCFYGRNSASFQIFFNLYLGVLVFFKKCFSRMNLSYSMIVATCIGHCQGFMRGTVSEIR